MKFSSGVDGLNKENQFLRTLTKIQLVVTVLLLGLVYSLYDKTPIIVERSSRGLEILRATEFARKESDLKEAVVLMLKARFDTSAVAPELFINPKQIILRATEQKDMQARGMSQSVIIKGVSFVKDQAVVDLDRLISIGDVRSSLKTQIKITFEETSPNELNPYGLLLSMAEPIEKKENK